MLTNAEKEVLENSMGADLDALGRSLGIKRNKMRGETSPPQPEPDDVYRARLKAWVETPFPELTTREREVAELLIIGRKNSEIAGELDVSIKTVDTHRGHVMQKLEVPNNVALLRLAIAKGWHGGELETGEGS